jgi:hypothetical protein
MFHELLRRSRILRRAVKWHRARRLADPGWRSLLEKSGERWSAALARARGGPKVLLASSIGGYWAGTSLESLLGVALTLRGAEVHVLLCDGLLPACQACAVRDFAGSGAFARGGPQGGGLCRSCFPEGERLFAGLGLEVHRFAENITAAEAGTARQVAASLPFAELGRHVQDGLAVGEHARAGALRFLARGDFDGEPFADAILRRFLEAAMLTAFAARHLLRAHTFTSATFHHGIYVPQGLIGEVARREGTRVVNWNPAYRKRCFIFSHRDTYHHTLIDEPVSTWEDLALRPETEEQLLSYLQSRALGTEDWIWFNRSAPGDRESIVRELGLDPARPVIGLLTNVIWDAQLHYPAVAFGGMMEWLLGTIGYFARRPDLQLVIRIHPAEVRGTLPSRQKAADEIRRAFPRLPSNVRVVPPESRLSTYGILALANAALIYGTKTGVELAAMGTPVIVAGEAWIRNKGFTLDAESAEHYYRLLDRLPLPGPMSEAEVARARRYAYHFFFRRMIPLPCMEPTGADPPYVIRLGGLDDLLPGRMPGLDVIVDGILSGSPFVYRAEEIA